MASAASAPEAMHSMQRAIITAVIHFFIGMAASFQMKNHLKKG
jgi:hypothetical protein